jgi:hypothetical protein
MGVFLRYVCLFIIVHPFLDTYQIASFLDMPFEGISIGRLIMHLADYIQIGIIIFHLISYYSEK